jgi:hypothetical protein
MKVPCRSLWFKCPTNCRYVGFGTFDDILCSCAYFPFFLVFALPGRGPRHSVSGFSSCVVIFT